MIDRENRIIYVDYSTLSTFQACHEKARLGYVESWRPIGGAAPPLSFGHAFHAAIASYYDTIAGGYRTTIGKWVKFAEGEWPSAVRQAQAAFLRDLKIEGATLPLTLESEERRSIERGLALVEAYAERWKDEPYDNLLDAAGAPLSEVPLRYDLCRYDDFYDVVYVGRIDRIMMNRATGRPVIFETKTTSGALSQFINQAKPNHQISGYFPAAQVLFPETRECVWDCIFVSTRKPDMKKALNDRFWMYGINIEDDFKRQTTGRSATDIMEWLFDAVETALDYCRWLTSGIARWPRSAPGACHNYGGCAFRPVCSLNDSRAFLETMFERKPWEPWKTTKESKNE